jgi:hypothetical protein
MLLALAAIALISAYVCFDVLRAAHFNACPVILPEKADRYQKTIAALDSIIDLSIKLATALVGLGAAILIGLKSGVRLRPIVRSFILLATICFTQSSLYAVWWRMGVAELWLNDCPSLISALRLTSRYDAHFYFFLAGLIMLALVITGAVFSEPEIKGDDL